MRDRDRIAWGDLVPLPRKRRDGATPEDLAARKFNIAKAKHKGRNHVANWERRLAERQIAKRKGVSGVEKQTKRRSLIEAVRAFWRGEADEHP